MSVPQFSFRNNPPVSRFPETGSDNTRRRYRRAFQDSFEESRYAIKGWNEYLTAYREQVITTANGSWRVMVKSGSEEPGEETGGFTPWFCQKMPDRIVRVYPAATWDGLGNRVEATYQGAAILPEQFVDIPLPTKAPNGYLYLKCTVDDSDPYHGLLSLVSIEVGTPDLFNFRQGNVVNLALCYYLLVGEADYSLDPVRSFVLTLRRYGPQGSTTWDVQPTG